MPNPASPQPIPKIGSTWGTSSPNEFRKQLENLAEEYECLHNLHQALTEESERLRTVSDLSACGEQDPEGGVIQTNSSRGNSQSQPLAAKRAVSITDHVSITSSAGQPDTTASGLPDENICLWVGPQPPSSLIRRNGLSTDVKKTGRIPGGFPGKPNNDKMTHADSLTDKFDMDLTIDRYPSDLVVCATDVEAADQSSDVFGDRSSDMSSVNRVPRRQRTSRSSSFRSLSTSTSASPRRSRPSNAPGLFSKWFDPGLTPETANEFLNEASYNESSSLAFTDAGSLRNLQSQADLCTISPVSFSRLSWDGMAFLCLLVELWITPFGLIFLDNIDTPGFMKGVPIVVTSFFSLDILLNFFTGYVENDTTVMKRGKIFWNYLRFWFWIDLVATFPFDLVLDAMSGGMFSMIRVGKASRVIKTVRYLKLLRIVKLVKISHQASSVTTHFKVFSPLRKTLIPIQVVLFLSLYAHIHGCLWAALQPEWVAVQSVTVALERYWESFWWAYTAVTVGSVGAQGTKRPTDYSSVIFLLEMIIATERMLFFTIASMKVSFESLKYADDARRAHTRMDVLKYLRTHNVCFETQIQVLFSLRDADGAQKLQRYFDEMTKQHLPRELRRTICAELWCSKLMTLGLMREIDEWHVDFTTELAQLVYEEVHPSKAILFKAFEASIAAYYIIRGELAVSNHPEDRQVPNFKAGMWVGENALASSTLRRSATLTTTSVTSLMALRGEDFQQLLSRLGLMEEFQKFCGAQLWRGLCGRCGELGDHFSDSCTAHLRRRSIVLPKKNSGKSQEGEGSAEANAVVRRRSSLREFVSGGDSAEPPTPEVRSLSRELRRFLAHEEMEWIGPILLDIDIHDLSELESLDMQKLRDAMGATFLDVAQENSLSAASIQKFREKQASGVHRTLFHQVSRLQHLVFLSHYKLEAGTEAALLRTEIEQAIAKDPGSLGHRFEHPVFLDSEDLSNLEDLQQRVRHTHNLVLLLTKGVFERPWVLVEILTARQEGVRVQPVNITKPGSEFVFPDNAFYRGLREGSVLDQAAMDEIEKYGFTLEDLEDAIRSVFKQIAVPYSPHKAKTIRQAEVDKLLRNCQLKSETAKERRKDQGAVVGRVDSYFSSVSSAAKGKTSDLSIQRHSHPSSCIESYATLSPSIVGSHAEGSPKDDRSHQDGEWAQVGVGKSGKSGQLYSI